MSKHERMFRHEHAHKLDDPERQKWLPVEDVLARLALRPGTAVADVGAGTGYFALPFARAVAPGGRVFAVDMQEPMLERLRARLEPGTLVDLVHAEATRTTLAPESVDVAFYANVWHEIDDRAAALREAKRILRAGGRVAILDWSPDVEQPPGPPLDHRVSAAEVSKTLADQGWRAIASERVGAFSYLVVGAKG